VLRTAVPFDQSGIHKEPSFFRNRAAVGQAGPRRGLRTGMLVLVFAAPTGRTAWKMGGLYIRQRTGSRRTSGSHKGACRAATDKQ